MHAKSDYEYFGEHLRAFHLQGVEAFDVTT